MVALNSTGNFAAVAAARLNLAKQCVAPWALSASVLPTCQPMVPFGSTLSKARNGMLRAGTSALGCQFCCGLALECCWNWHSAAPRLSRRTPRHLAFGTDLPASPPRGVRVPMSPLSVQRLRGCNFSFRDVMLVKWSMKNRGGIGESFCVHGGCVHLSSAPSAWCRE